MPQPVTLHNFIDSGMTNQALSELGQLGYSMSRYDNPFESKSFLLDKSVIQDTAALSLAFDMLRSSEMCKWVGYLLDLPIMYADFRHYGGLFVYHEGDYLEPHVDAGIHPVNHLRKVATSLLYLTDAYLSMWRGDPCTDPDPEVWLQNTHYYKAGSCVVFANHDTAWHSVPVMISEASQRVVLTVSYMADDTLNNPRYRNPRTRAYFARRHGQPDTPELALLRSKRASEEKHEEVYRLESH